MDFKRLRSASSRPQLQTLCPGQKARVGAELCVLRSQLESSTALEEVKCVVLGSGWRAGEHGWMPGGQGNPKDSCPLWGLALGDGDSQWLQLKQCHEFVQQELTGFSTARLWISISSTPRQT